ncbi:type IV toxin-antitoxin system AbiEi family antitoxin domain-containing protein, partial [Sphingobium chlorophenolicum]
AQRLAAALVQNPLGDEVRHVQTKLLPQDLGVIEQTTPEGFALRTSTAERAALELLHLAPKIFGLVEAGLIMESMTLIRPKLMQSLLEQCASIKARRLFLYLAERADLPVIRHLDLDRIDLGVGDRSLVPNGRYVAKYQLLLPKELVDPG